MIGHPVYNFTFILSNFKVFFHHPVFGSKRKNLQKFNDIGKNYIINFVTYSIYGI